MYVIQNRPASAWARIARGEALIDASHDQSIPVLRFKNSDGVFLTVPATVVNSKSIPAKDVLQQWLDANIIGARVYYVGAFVWATINSTWPPSPRYCLEFDVEVSNSKLVVEPQGYISQPYGLEWCERSPRVRRQAVVNGVWLSSNWGYGSGTIGYSSWDATCRVFSDEVNQSYSYAKWGGVLPQILLDSWPTSALFRGEAVAAIDSTGPTTVVDSTDPTTIVVPIVPTIPGPTPVALPADQSQLYAAITTLDAKLNTLISEMRAFSMRTPVSTDLVTLNSNVLAVNSNIVTMGDNAMRIGDATIAAIPTTSRRMLEASTIALIASAISK